MIKDLLTKKQKEELQKLTDEIMNDAEREDMTPTMSDIYHWGLRNLPIKIMKVIIKRNKE